MASIDAVSYNAQPLGTPPYTALFDTGTTIIYIPPDAYFAFLALARSPSLASESERKSFEGPVVGERGVRADVRVTQTVAGRGGGVRRAGVARAATGARGGSGCNMTSS